MKSEIIHFNVGGTLYDVAEDTLLKAEEKTMLANLVSDKWRFGKQETIFIDRDGERFKYILDWYRDGKINVPKTVAIDAVRSDALFFGLPESAIIEEVKEHSIDKIMSFLRDEATYLAKLNMKLDQTTRKNELENFALWAIQQMLHKLDFRSSGKIHVILSECAGFKSKPADVGDVVSEIRRVLATDELLSASTIFVARFGYTNCTAIEFSFS